MFTLHISKSILLLMTEGALLDVEPKWNMCMEFFFCPTEGGSDDSTAAAQNKVSTFIPSIPIWGSPNGSESTHASRVQPPLARRFKIIQMLQNLTNSITSGYMIRSSFSKKHANHYREIIDSAKAIPLQLKNPKLILLKPRRCRLHTKI